MPDWLKILLGLSVSIFGYVFATGQGWGRMSNRMENAERAILQLQSESLRIGTKLQGIAEMQAGMASDIENQSSLLREIRDDLRRDRR